MSKLVKRFSAEMLQPYSGIPVAGACVSYFLARSETESEKGTHRRP